MNNVQITFIILLSVLAFSGLVIGAYFIAKLIYNIKAKKNKKGSFTIKEVFFDQKVNCWRVNFSDGVSIATLEKDPFHASSWAIAIRHSNGKEVAFVKSVKKALRS